HARRLTCNPRGGSNRRGGTLTRITSLIAFGCAALALAGGARTAIAVGVSDDRGKEANASAFFSTLHDLGLTENRVSIIWNPAQSDDELKGVDPTINVIGVGLSPRGNDNPNAKSNISRSPVRFIHDLGVAYRASHRTKPLMDELAFHPYPAHNSDLPQTGYTWPNAGLPNLNRVKQAVWDAFNGTTQATFKETGKTPFSP